MNNKDLLKKQIQQAELQIKKLDQQAYRTEVCEDLYNSLVLRKAIMKKELAELEKNPLVEKIKSILPRKEKLICDYFN